MSGSKATYLEFCSKNEVPLHLQPWWLDAVCGQEAWDAALTSDQCGILPFFKTRRWGLSVIHQAPLSAYAGPWFVPHEPGVPAHKRLAREHRTLNELISQLPKAAFFLQNFRPEIKNWLPFYWSGFRQTLRYTYVLPNTADLDERYFHLKGSVRSDIRRAGQCTRIVRVDAPEPLFRLYAHSLARKNRRPSYSLSNFSRLHCALTDRGQSLGFLAIDQEEGREVAGIFLAFDTQQAAVILSGLDPAYKHTGALNSLYWEAVRFCAERNLSLDFEGSMEPGIERVFRAFGAQQVPYFRVWRAGNKILDWLY